jgi:hypothetical protein
VGEVGDGVVFYGKYGEPYIEITDDVRCCIKMRKNCRFYLCKCGSSKCKIYVPVVDESGRISYYIKMFCSG